MHEEYFAKFLSEYYTKNGVKNNLEVIRKPIYFNGIRGNFNLLVYGFKNATAKINIVVSRLGISSIVRNLFNKNKTIIVLHYYDKQDGKGMYLSLYYKFLFFILKYFKPKKVAVVGVAYYWVDFFKEKGIKNCFLFPNLFNQNIYNQYVNQSKNGNIHLGQFSWKNDKIVFDLARKLSRAGYKCYFSTNNLSEEEFNEFYEVKFEPFDTYLNNMAKSKYTIALTKIREGWNRVAHESMLVGTPVIGYNRGGLGELLLGSNSIIVDTAEEAYDKIINNEFQLINYNYLNNFDTSKAENYLLPITNWLK